MELKVVFRNNEQDKLIGTMLLPTDPITTTGVIFCHGFLAHKDFGFFPRVAQELFSLGIPSLRFDCRACGESQGEFHPTYESMTQDIISAVPFFKKQESIQKIILLGHSMGGTSVIEAAGRTKMDGIITCGAVAHPYASVKKKIDKMRSVDGKYTLRFLGRTYYFTQRFFDDAKVINPLQSISNITSPKLIIHGKIDERVSYLEAEELFANAKNPKEICLIDEANHGFEGFYEDLTDKVVKFVKRIN